MESGRGHRLRALDRVGALPGRSDRRYSDTPHGVGSGTRESAHLGPVFLPDGRHFLFGLIGGDGTGTYVASLDSSDRKRIPVEDSKHGFSSPDLLFFMRNRTLMAQHLDLDASPTDRGAYAGGGRCRQAWTGRRFRRIRERHGRVLVRRPGHHAAHMVSAQWHCGGDAGTTGRIHESRAVIRWTSRRRSIGSILTPGIWLLDATRGTATRTTAGGIYESTPVWSPDACRLCVRGSAGHAAEPVPEANWNGGRRENGCSARRFRAFPQSWSRRRPLLRYVTIGPEDRLRYLGAADARRSKADAVSPDAVR